MLRYLFAFVVIIHGLIHLTGFSKAFQYGNINHFAKEISKPFGMAWLLACLLFLVAEILLILGKKHWWLVAILAVALSQVLIIIYWHDSRFGTILNLVILAVVLVAAAEWRFNRMVEQEVSELLANKCQDRLPVNDEKIKRLPPVVQKWIQHSGVTARTGIQTVRLKQKGMMRTKPASAWMDFTATQYFNIADPSFNWQVKVRLNPFLYLTGRDKLEKGIGEMLIRLLSLKTVVHSGGTAEINQGSLLRYLSEICWFPPAVLHDNIHWEVKDDFSAQATMRYGDTAVSGIFYFNRHAEVCGFEAMRYGTFNGKMSLEKWHIESKEFRTFHGIRVPSHSEVTWKLKDGDFTWLKLELLDVDYDPAEMYM